MQVRKVVPLAAVGVLAAGAFLPASAAPAKTITKSYEMHKYPLADVCADPLTNGEAVHFETFTAPSTGTLTATIDDFEGDWDLALLNKDGIEIAKGGGSNVDSPALGPSEIMIYKITKPGTYTVSSCNFFGTLDAKGSYTFKPTK